MSDVFGELRSIFAAKVLPWVLPFKKVPHINPFEGAIAHALAQTKAQDPP